VIVIEPSWATVSGATNDATERGTPIAATGPYRGGAVAMSWRGKAAPADGTPAKPDETPAVKQ